MAFKNILVPHDFDTVSDNALDNAIEIAKIVRVKNYNSTYSTRYSSTFN